MGTFLTPEDLTPFAEIDGAKADAMIADAEALALTVAPCLGDAEVTLSDAQAAAVKAILRGSVLRWNDSGSGAFQAQTTGPFSVQLDTRQQRRSLFWPSEIESLQEICSAISGGQGGAFSVDTVSAGQLNHSETCSAVLGANYCDCGAVLTGGWPLFGL